MKKFDDLFFKSHPISGEIAQIFFDNGYGASVVCSAYSYGGEDGLYEVAVLNSSGDIVYDTPVTTDVIGWLTPSKVSEVLIQIQSLPKKNITVN